MEPVTSTCQIYDINSQHVLWKYTVTLCKNWKISKSQVYSTLQVIQMFKCQKEYLKKYSGAKTAKLQRL